MTKSRVKRKQNTLREGVRRNCDWYSNPNIEFRYGLVFASKQATRLGQSGFFINMKEQPPGGRAALVRQIRRGERHVQHAGGPWPHQVSDPGARRCRRSDA